MRTTLTLDDDVAANLRRIQRREERSLKDVVNDALRRGLADLDQPSAPRTRFRTKPRDLGKCLIGNVDNVAEVLAIAEGEDFK